MHTYDSTGIINVTVVDSKPVMIFTDLNKLCKIINNNNITITTNLEKELTNFYNFSNDLSRVRYDFFVNYFNNLPNITSSIGTKLLNYPDRSYLMTEVDSLSLRTEELKLLTQVLYNLVFTRYKDVINEVQSVKQFSNVYSKDPSPEIYKEEPKTSDVPYTVEPYRTICAGNNSTSLI